MHSNQRNEKIRDRREEDLPTKVPFWWITVEQQRPKQNCIFHLIHSSISHRSFFAAAFSFLGFTYSMRRSRSAFPLLAASYFLGGFLSLDFFSWPIAWHILSIIYHDPSCFSYLSWNLEEDNLFELLSKKQDMTDYCFWLFLAKKFWCQMCLHLSKHLQKWKVLLNAFIAF